MIVKNKKDVSTTHTEKKSGMLFENERIRILVKVTKQVW